MTLPTIGGLPSYVALDRADLLAPPVEALLRTWPHADQVVVVEIDPDLADTVALNEAYSLDPAASANCVVVSGKRAGEERIAACLVRADTRADVNHTVKRLLDTRKVSFHPHERLSRRPAWSTAGSPRSGCPPAGGSWSTPAWWRSSRP